MTTKTIELCTIDKKAFTVSSDFFTIALGEANLLYLKNPSNSGKTIFIVHIRAGILGTEAKARIYKNPSLTADGTLLNSVNMYIEANTPSASAEVYKSPTGSNRGTFFDTISNTGGDRGNSMFIPIAPGNSLLITVEVGVAATCHASIKWIEESI